MLISKTLSNLANGIEFGDKEGYMIIMNNLIRQNQPRMQEFLRKLVSVPKKTAVDDLVDTSDNDPKSRIQVQAHEFTFGQLLHNRERIMAKFKNTPVPPYYEDLQDSKEPSDEHKREGDGKTTSGAASLKELLNELLDLYSEEVVFTPREEDKEKKQVMQKELMVSASEGFSNILRRTPPTARPSKRLLRLLLMIEKQKTKDLEEELRLIKLKLHTEVQTKRELQLQLLRGGQVAIGNGKPNENIHTFANITT
jgi:hypothetical protein